MYDYKQLWITHNCNNKMQLLSSCQNIIHVNLNLWQNDSDSQFAAFNRINKIKITYNYDKWTN